MIRVRILTKDFHTFQPFIKSAQQLYNYGIELVQPTDKNYDISLVGHSLFQDKKLGSLSKSTEMGLDFLSKVEGPYVLVDGQDSHSLIGSFEVFKESDALFMMKHSLLKDRSLYNEEWVGGRYYWGKSEDYGIKNQNYKPEDFDKYSDKIVLSGTNWIGVSDIQWFDYRNIEKLFDVSAMFQHPHPECHEFELKPSQDFYYNQHRQPVLDKIKHSPFMVAKLYKGRRVPTQTYFKYIQTSKVLLAPFGYGEMAPRDLESAQLGSLLIKPNMNHVDTYPNIYVEDETYISCKHDYSDLEEKIEYAVENFNVIRDVFVSNLRNKYIEQYHEYYLADYIKNLFQKMGVL